MGVLDTPTQTSSKDWFGGSRPPMERGGLILIHLEGGDEGFLRNVHLAELAHLLLVCLSN
jgi:hypothetical protein